MCDVPSHAAPRPAEPCLRCLAKPRLASPGRALPAIPRPAAPRPALPCLALPRLRCLDTPDRGAPRPAKPAEPRRALPCRTTSSLPSLAEPTRGASRLALPSLRCCGCGHWLRFAVDCPPRRRVIGSVELERSPAHSGAGLAVRSAFTDPHLRSNAQHQVCRITGAELVGVVLDFDDG